jgi:hypothetical protein
MTIDIAIPLDEDAASALQSDPVKRQVLGRLLSNWLRPDGQTGRLLRAMDNAAAQAEANGLTEDALNAELAAYNAERRA